MRVRGRALVLVLGLLFALVFVLVPGCGQQRAPVDSCDDDLAGVWHEIGAPAHGYHFLASRSGGYEVFAMFDTTAPPDGSDKRTSPVVYAPWVWDLERRPSAVTGKRRQRVTREGKSCQVVTEVQVRECAGDRLTIAVQAAEVADFDRCEIRVGETRVVVLGR